MCRTYPEPDAKIRGESVQLFSGWNVGNTLTAISRLGAANAKFLTKVGSDPNGKLKLSDFRNAVALPCLWGRFRTPGLYFS